MHLPRTSIILQETNIISVFNIFVFYNVHKDYKYFVMIKINLKEFLGSFKGIRFITYSKVLTCGKVVVIQFFKATLSLILTAILLHCVFSSFTSFLGICNSRNEIIMNVGDMYLKKIIILLTFYPIKAAYI